MFKNIYLLLEKTFLLYKKNRLVFILFIVAQIITIFAYTFFFTTIIKTRAAYISEYTYMRTISVDSSSCNINEKTTNIIDIATNNNVVGIENISMYFIDESSKFQRKLVGYLYPDRYSLDVFGTPISLNDIKECNYVVVPRNQNKRYDPNADEYSVGENMIIMNKSFKAIGIRNRYYLDEIPYTTGLKLLKLTGFDILLPERASDNQKELLKDYLENNIKNIKVTLPKTIPEKVIASLFIPLVSSIFIGLIAILNFTFLYKYMIGKSKKDYILLRICGCSRIKSILLLFSQMGFLFTISFFISLFMLLSLNNKNIISIFNLTSITFMDCLKIYMSFILIIMLIIAPFIINIFKKSLIENQKLL